MLWQRLEDFYGSPEVIENALLKKIEDFPKISVRDNRKLRELGDVLMELEAAKTNGYLPGLSYQHLPRSQLDSPETPTRPAREVDHSRVMLQRTTKNSISSILSLRQLHLRTSKNAQ